MNRSFVSFCIFIFACSVLNALPASNIEKYQGASEGVDIEPILKNDKIVSMYIKCVMEEGPCTADGKRVSKVIPEIIQTTCEKCSNKQKYIVRTVMRHMYNKRKSDFDRIFNKFDPEHKFYDNMMAFMNTNTSNSNVTSTTN